METLTLLLSSKVVVWMKVSFFLSLLCCAQSKTVMLSMKFYCSFSRSEQVIFPLSLSGVITPVGCCFDTTGLTLTSTWKEPKRDSQDEVRGFILALKAQNIWSLFPSPCFLLGFYQSPDGLWTSFKTTLKVGGWGGFLQALNMALSILCCDFLSIMSLFFKFISVQYCPFFNHCKRF